MIQLNIHRIDSKNKVVHVPPSEKNESMIFRGVEFVQYINKEKKPVLCVQLAVCHFAKQHVSGNIAQKNY
jgi:hypothetical protein